MLINPHTNLNKSNKNPQNEPNQSKPKHFNINTCLSKSHKNLKKKHPNPKNGPAPRQIPTKPQQKTGCGQNQLAMCICQPPLSFCVWACCLGSKMFFSIGNQWQALTGSSIQRINTSKEYII